MNGAAKLEKKPTSLERLSKVTDITAAQTLMRDAFPLSRWGTAQRACWQAYRRLGLATERRARAIWNGEAKRIDASEMDALRNHALKQARQEYARFKDRIATLENALRVSDPKFHGTQIDALRSLSSGSDSPMD